jgi:hypothetical protein
MKKIITPLAVVALIGGYAGIASALCDFDIAPAKGVKSTLVRAYAPCPGTEHDFENSETEAGTASCSPVKVKALLGEVPAGQTPYNFSAKGKCSVSTTAKLLDSCADLTKDDGTPLGLQAVPCHVTFVKSKCSGILGSGSTANDDTGGTLIDEGDDGWTLATLSRATLADPSNGDMTVIDFPVQFNYDTPSKGKLKLDSNSAEALKPLVGVNNADLPTCTSIEIVDVVVKDPNDLPFARLGGATVEKPE